MTEPRGRKENADISFAQEIDPAIKLFCLILLTVSVPAIDSVWGLLLESAFIVAVIYIFQLSFKETLAFCGRLRPLLALTFLLNTCFYAPDFAFARFWIFSPSVYGAAEGLFTAIRIVMICTLFEIFVITTKPLSLLRPLTAIFYPFKLVGISSGHMALAFSCSLEFFGSFPEKYREISELSKEKGNTEGKRKLLPENFQRILIPTVNECIHAVRNKIHLLEARGFPGDDAAIKNLEKTELSAYDYYAAIVSAAVFAAQLIVF